MDRCISHSFLDERESFSSRNHMETMGRQQICYGAREKKNVKVPQISIGYKLEMVHLQSKNVAVITFTKDMTEIKKKIKN